MPPAISVVIPLYNKRPYIERCLQSVRNQTFTDYQIVVVNDGSTDGGEELVRPFLGTGDLLINQKNAGVSAARNRGAEEAQADLIALLDADDEWLPEHLQDTHQLAHLFPEAGLLGSGKREIRGSLIRDIQLSGSSPRVVDYFAIASTFPVDSSSVVMRRHTFLALGGFRVGEALGEDIELWARIAMHHCVALHPRITSIYQRDAQTHELNAESSPRGTGLELTYAMLERAVAEGSCPPSRSLATIRYAAELRMRDARALILQGRCAEAAALLKNETVSAAGLARQAQVLMACARVRSCLPPPIYGAFVRIARFARRHSKQVFTRTYGDIIVRQYYADRDALEA